MGHNSQGVFLFFTHVFVFVFVYNPLMPCWTVWHVPAKGHNRQGMPGEGQAWRHLTLSITKYLWMPHASADIQTRWITQIWLIQPNLQKLSTIIVVFVLEQSHTTIHLIIFSMQVNHSIDEVFCKGQPYLQHTSLVHNTKYWDTEYFFIGLCIGYLHCMKYLYVFVNTFYMNFSLQ